MLEKLSKKDQEFISEVALTGNNRQSALKVYGGKNNNSASVNANKKLKKPEFQEALIELKLSLAERLPDDLLNEKHIALLNAIDDKGQMDTQAVSKGLDMGYKLKGAYAPDKSINLNLNGDIVATEELEALADQLNELARNKEIHS
jgi:phage terminase small subunit